MARPFHRPDPTDNLQHVIGNELMVMSFLWHGVMDAGGIPDRKTTSELIKRSTRITRALFRFRREMEVASA